jgi:hypothetical protein
VTLEEVRLVQVEGREMGLYDYENSGLLFKNERNEARTNPPWSGGVRVGGKKYKVALWSRQGKLGQYLQLSFDPVEDGDESVQS